MPTEEQLVRSGSYGAPRQEDFVFDAWTPLGFKESLAGHSSLGGWSAPTWVGDHARRLQAYKVLAAYRDNAARLFLQEPDPGKRQEHREYGDGALIVSTAVAALLGGEQNIAVDGAEGFTEADGAEVEADVKRAHELQEWMRQWSDKERLTRKLMEGERDAVSLGDGVYSLGWNEQRGRTRLRVWDPGFYFPVLDDGPEDEFPRRVHIAWELPPEPEDTAQRRRVRRITWELVDINPDTGVLYPPTKHPWNEEPTSDRCLMSDAVWTLEQDRATVDDLRESDATFMLANGPEGPVEMRRVDLGIDFIPVVHVPNTVAEKEHYGRSTLMTIAQLLDDISNNDTDLQRAAATTGTPPIALSGATTSGKSVGYRPGTVWELGEGKMDVLDTSRSLDALLKLLESLLKRLHVNARVPEAVVGRVDASDVPSGLALALSFGPLEAMVKEMRLTRNEKHPLILKFQHRIAQANKQKDVPQVWDLEPRIDLGSYLPADQEGAVKMAAELLGGTGGRRAALSRETVIRILEQAGFPIEDAAAELLRVQQEDFDGASKLLDALGDEEQVADYLGREAPTPAPEANSQRNGQPVAPPVEDPTQQPQQQQRPNGGA